VWFVTPAWIGARSAFARFSDRSRDRRGEDAGADVVAVAERPPAGREHGRVVAYVACPGAVELQLLEQQRGDVDDAAASVGLCLLNGQLRPGKVEVAPAKLAGLADAQPGERHRREQRPVVAGGVEQRADLV
jgi:hypothetical protein